MENRKKNQILRSIEVLILVKVQEYQVAERV